MSLINMESENGYLLALDNNAVAVGDPLTESLDADDYRKVKGARINGNNQSIFTFSADTVSCTTDITGETLYFMYDGTVHTMTNVTSTLNGTTYDVDVSSITAGGTPTSATIPYIIKFNDIVATENFVNFNGSVVYFQYDNIVFDASRTITPEVNLKIKDMKVDEIAFRTYLVDLILPEPMTSNTTPANSVTGTNLNDNSLAYKVFDGVSTGNVLGTTDTNNVCSLIHEYQFDNPTIVYKFGMFTAAAANAPATYTLSGSTDGTNYTELLNISQEISIDDLKLDKKIDTSLQAAYTYYKIEITSGNAASTDIIVNQYSLYIENPTDNDEV